MFMEFKLGNSLEIAEELQCQFRQNKQILQVITLKSKKSLPCKQSLTFNNMNQGDIIHYRYLRQLKGVKEEEENGDRRFSFQSEGKFVPDQWNTQNLLIKIGIDIPRGDYSLSLTELGLRRRKCRILLSFDSFSLQFEGSHQLRLGTERLKLEYKHKLQESQRQEKVSFQIDVAKLGCFSNQLTLEIGEKIFVLNELFQSQNPLEFAQQNQEKLKNIYPNLIFQKVKIEQYYQKKSEIIKKVVNMKCQNDNFPFYDQLAKIFGQKMEQNEQHQNVLYGEILQLSQESIITLKDQQKVIIRFQEFYNTKKIHSQIDQLNYLVVEVYSITKQYENDIETTIQAYEAKIREQKKQIQDYQETYQEQETKIKLLNQLNLSINKQVQESNNVQQNQTLQEELQNLCEKLQGNQDQLKEQNKKINILQQEIKNLQSEKAELKEKIRSIEFENQPSEDLELIAKKNLLQKLRQELWQKNQNLLNKDI